jgi:SSS family transporter
MLKHALILLLSLTSTCWTSELPQQKAEIKKLSNPPFQISGGTLCSFGNLVAATTDNGSSSEVWLGDQQGAGNWKKSELSLPLNAATAKWNGSWIFAGGELEKRPVASVGILELADGMPTLRPLPDLPRPVTGAAAAVIENSLYVFGGDTRTDAEGPVSDLWILNLKNPVEWKKGPVFPSSPRAFAAATEQYGMLCVFGGQGKNGPLNETWVFRPKPLEGTRISGWKRLSDIPANSAYRAALPLGQCQVVLFPDEPEGGNLPNSPLLFHTLTDAWCALDAFPELSEPAIAGFGETILALGTKSDGTPAAIQIKIPRSVRNLSWIDYLAIAIYFALIMGIGVFFSGKQESSAEFSLGNRKVKWWAAGISMFATGASAISFMAIPALAFATNLVWLFPLVAMIPAYFVTAHLIYPLLRRMEITSTYEYLERRFNRTLRVIASLQAIIFQTLAKTSIVLLLPSLAISSVTGINVYASVIIMGVLTTIYTAIGGFDAVIWTEVLQAALMLFAPLAIMWVCIQSLPGGFGEFFKTGMDYQKFDFAILSWDLAVPAVWVLLLMAFLNNTVVPAGDQPIVQRVFSSPLPEVRKVNLTFTVCGIFIGIMTNVMGIAIFAYFRAKPGMLDPLSQNDQIVPLFVTQAMPVGFSGLVIAAIFAAAMSTVASIMNSVATIFTEDFFIKLRPSATDRQRLLTLKATSYIVGILGTLMALLLATRDLKSMMVVWTQFTALLGGGIVGVYSLGMFSKRANGFGAICGAISSIAITGMVNLYTNLHWGTYVPIAIFSCILIGYLCSLLKPQRKDLMGLTVFTPSLKSK